MNLNLMTYPGTEMDWYSYKRHDFMFGGSGSIIVEPHTPLPHRPWIWRARFFGVEPQTDLELLYHGYHLVYTDVSDLFGAPAAVNHWNNFYRYLVSEFGFHEKTILEGFSRGGLIVYNWASVNTDKVACIYADAPVCDFKSWPGGMGRAQRYPEEWLKCLAAYNLSEEQALSYEDIPVNNCMKIASAGIPVIHVCGDADEVVPIEENSLIVERKFKEKGGNFKIIIKEGVGHHPHSLIEPAPIVKFIIESTRT